MKILARGEKIRTEELKQKLSSLPVELVCVDDTDLLSANIAQYDVIFDLNFDDHPDQLKYLIQAEGKVVFVSAVKIQLADALQAHGHIPHSFIGLNALPGFINRSLAEVSLADAKDEGILQKTMQQLQWEYKLINDRVGMITPRIIFMIINEACYTLQEGTATIADIDTSMKLGTNYPFGPFEWADKIGIRQVYETLEAIYQDTYDERYKICPLLKTKYLKGEGFYS
jgi:3-hydroxybutyryl-CoA dehydrogenase